MVSGVRAQRMRTVSEDGSAGRQRNRFPSDGLSILASNREDIPRSRKGPATAIYLCIHRLGVKGCLGDVA
jgi:hypothetical protein